MILYFLAGFIGIIIATIMLGIEIEGYTFLTSFILKMFGMSIFVESIWLINQNREDCPKIAIKMKNESSL
ncbi:hypothetical protein NSS76_03250 [Bacillus sp. FSL R5-0654]|uniref:hypothetical protein n=1 Tax=Bacillus sp. FSL R5-0654 TaxID=2954589 RepID=UPI0030F926C4